MFGFRNFMAGRYGSDALTYALVIFSLVLGLLMNLFRVPFLQLIMLLPLGYCFFRMFSRNIERRAAENRAFLKFWQPIGKWFMGRAARSQDAAHRYFRCPKCRQKLRVPRGKGRINITCPKCGNKFIKKT